MYSPRWRTHVLLCVFAVFKVSVILADPLVTDDDDVDEAVSKPRNAEWQKKEIEALKKNTPECFGEKIGKDGSFEIAMPKHYHNQGEKGTCTSDATIRGFEYAAAREFTDPAAFAKAPALSTAFAVLQTCSPDESTNTEGRLNAKYQSQKVGGNDTFFDSEDFEHLVSVLTLIGKIPYADTPIDEAAKKAQTKLLAEASDAASRVQLAVEKKKLDIKIHQKEEEYKEASLRASELHEKASELSTKILTLYNTFLPLGPTENGVMRYGSSYGDIAPAMDDKLYQTDEKDLPAGIDHAAFRKNKEILVEVNKLSAQLKTIKDQAKGIIKTAEKPYELANDQIASEELVLLKKESVSLCKTSGQCIRPINQSAKKEEGFDSSRIFHSQEYNKVGACNPEAVMQALMKGACLGIPSLVALDVSQDIRVKNANSTSWEKTGNKSGGHSVLFKGIEEKDGKELLIFANSWEGGEELSLPIEKICSIRKVSHLLFTSPIRGEALTEQEAFAEEDQSPKNAKLLAFYKARKDFFIKPRKTEDLPQYQTPFRAGGKVEIHGSF